MVLIVVRCYNNTSSEKGIFKTYRRTSKNIFMIFNAYIERLSNNLLATVPCSMFDLSKINTKHKVQTETLHLINFQ